MKRIVIIVIALFCYFVGTSQQNKTAKLEKLKWLVGEWVRTNAKPGRSGSETWMVLAGGDLGGYGVSMKGRDTLLLEKFKLTVKQNEVYYVADVPENKEPVYFKLTSITKNGFVCENPTHDFPKMITYKKEGNKLTATISGDGKSFDYLFERKN